MPLKIPLSFVQFCIPLRKTLNTIVKHIFSRMEIKHNLKRISLALISTFTILVTCFIITPASMSIANFGYQEQEEIYFTVYRTIIPNVTSEYVLNIAVNIFNLTNPKIEYDDKIGYIIRNTYPKELHVDLSGFIYYCDWSKVGNESYMPNLPSEQEAKTIAENFLNKYGLMPQGTLFMDISYNTIAVYEVTTCETIIIHDSLNVNFEIKSPDGIPFDGPGAKIRVVLGDCGEIIGLLRFWRDIEVYGTYPGISESEAIELFMKNCSYPVEITNIHLAYWTEPGLIKQQYIIPYYLIDYKYTINDITFTGRAKIPAIANGADPIIEID